MSEHTAVDAADQQAPSVVQRYFAAADAKDFHALADCFTEDGFAVDEGETFQGHDRIVEWREGVNRWTYTTDILTSESISPGDYRITVHLVGDFPGGEADLAFRFSLDGDRIAALTIA